VLTPSDLGVRSPLIDLFSGGDVPRDVRLLAARGQLATDVASQLALLALTSADADIEVAATAEETLRSLPAASVQRYLAAADVPAGLRAWCLARGIAPPVDLPQERPSEEPLPDDAGEGGPAEDGGLLASLPVPARVKLAMLGSREQRAVLVRDPNRVVSTAVLASPKLSEAEVETFARMSNVSVDVLRIIGTHRAWLRNYGVVAALVRNPRTPPAISVGLVTRLQERDVKGLAVDRNIPEVLKRAARKMLQVQDARRA
jgi:hypothetical protein